jgi:phenylalanine-4-hydroxylase
MKMQLNRKDFRDFTPEEHLTWRMLYNHQAVKRDRQLIGIFSEGLRTLGMTAERVPPLDDVNARLRKATGFEGVPVEGLEEDASFFEMLESRLFPIGNFIRDRRDLSYTPAPDVFHDLYGHLPFLADPEYADFCAELGRVATRHRDRPEMLTQFSRLFWFTIEFGLVNTPEGRRIFGAGIASSIGECEYALSSEPKVKPFDIDQIRNQVFKIDEFQQELYLIDTPRQLYECLPEFERQALRGIS